MRPGTYPDRLGIAKFDRLEIICYEVFNENGCFSHHEYLIGEESFNYRTLLQKLDDEHPTVSRLLFKLGEESFLESVLSWDASLDTTRDAFYKYLARQVKDWDEGDQPRG